MCFAKMKSCWQSKIVAFEATKMRDVSKAEFMSVWAPAYKEAFDESTVRAAFKVTGIIPFNPDFVTEAQMKPSVATSTRAEFPMPQPSPVRAITNAMRMNPPTRFDLSPSHLAPVASTSALPETPTRRRSRDEDENIDPALLSASKRMRTLYAHLGCSTTGSLLLRSPKIKSYNNPILPPVIQQVPRALMAPNWSLSSPGPSDAPYKTRGQLEAENAELRTHLGLAHQNVTVRDHIIEEAHATMVFQNMGLRKTNEALHQQEEKAATDRARLFKGKAQCLSSDEFHSAVAAMDAEGGWKGC